jgi:4'-phosphopantetheinyl transferase
MTDKSLECFSLRDNEIHIWTTHLVSDDVATAELASILDRDERARAARFAFDLDRIRFIQSHGFLRHVLAPYAHCGAAELVFTKGNHGKPRLMSVSSDADLHFSLSHTRDYCVVAVRLQYPLGVDVEERRDLPNAVGIAHQQFAPEESRHLAGLTGIAQRDAFLSLWTHKEAIVKALGINLGDNLGSAEFEFGAGRLRLKSWNGDRSIVRGWSVVPLNLGLGHIGALATVYPFRSLKQQSWDEIDLRSKSFEPGLAH